MSALFATPGMTAMTVIVCVIQLVSLILMSALLFEYRHIHVRRIELLHSLDGHGLVHRIWERRILMLVYILITIAITCTSLFLYIFQPHLL